MYLFDYVFRTVIQISKGINGFDYSEQLSLIGKRISCSCNSNLPTDQFQLEKNELNPPQ